MASVAPLSVEMKISVTVGLVLLALLHSASTAIFQRVLPPIDPCACVQCSGSTEAPRGGINFDAIQMSSGVRSTLPVNERARVEVKHAGTPAPAPAAATKEAPCVNCKQPVQVPVSATKPVATTARYNLALFIGQDAQSQKLLQWFNTDPQLQSIRSQCNFQVYTPTNAIYRTRYALDIPADSFPAYLYSDPGGGLVHAGGAALMPSSPGEVANDLMRSQSLQIQVVAAAKQQPPPQVDLPTLQEYDCDENGCRPRPNRDPFFNQDRPPLVDRQPAAKTWLDYVVHQGAVLDVNSIVIVACVAAGIFILWKK